MEETRNNLSLLSDLIEPVKSRELPNKDDEFIDFENDLDFINEAISDEPLKTSEYKDEIAEEHATVVEKQPAKKKVSFDLPKIVEYLSDFESDSEEDNVKNVKLPNDSVEQLEEGISSNFVGSSKQNEGCVLEQSKLSNESINYCDKCKCRMATVSIYEIPKLNTLFSNIKVKNSKKSMHFETENDRQMKTCTTRKKNNSTHHLKNEPLKEKFKRRSKGVSSLRNTNGNDDLTNLKHGNFKSQFHKPLDNSWMNCSNGSLMLWLKTKHKEIKQKKLQDRRNKREERRAKKINELDKMCKKQISDKKVDEWMKQKTREAKSARRKIEAKVVPAPESQSSKSLAAPPDGYMILNTFSPRSKKDKDIIEKATENGNVKKSHKKPRRLKPKNTIDISSTEQADVNQKNARITYDDWLKSKKETAKKIKINEARNNLDSDLEKKIFVDERNRRFKEKQDMKRKTESKAPKQTKNDNKNEPHEKSEKTIIVSSIDFTARPEPQGCDDTLSMKNSIEMLQKKDESRCTNYSRNDNSCGQAAKDALAYFTKDSKRAWMKEEETN